MSQNSMLILGGGFMGSLLAKYFRPYIQVTLYEAHAARYDELMNDQQFDGIRFTNRLDNVITPTFVIEAVPEKLAIKHAVLNDAQQVFGETPIYCTNTSSILISDIARQLRYPKRLIGTHFFSPADISPLVEIIPSEWTDDSMVDKIMTFLKASRKKPILLKQEIEGFVANRLQSALAREAMSLVQKGIVTAEEVDFVAKWGLGIRLALTGPIEQRDINGLDTHLSIVETVYPTLENTTEPLDILKNLVTDNKLGTKTKQGFYNWDNISDSYLTEKSNKLLKIIKIVSEDES